ncbi:uncharacterized protein LOC112591082 isoform X1 [Melanaphis sacchari]|uniref:uncharacterized protein LOC112591082 isoform X1 n=1 Tax=Melanaphis sacchari TaxID=742174 RepID=UPI000DC13B54|nr:uncharacterized protein LOC112591082 isoform X1 [Melanaphis sacchari]
MESHLNYNSHLVSKMESGEVRNLCLPNITPLENLSSYHWKLLKLKGRLDTITERMSKRKSGTLEPYTTYMDEDSTDKIDKFLLMSQVKPLESDDDDMDLSKIN